MAQLSIGLMRKILLGLMFWPSLSLAVPTNPTQTPNQPQEHSPTQEINPSTVSNPMMDNYNHTQGNHGENPTFPQVPMDDYMDLLTLHNGSNSEMRSFDTSGPFPTGMLPDTSYCDMLLNSPVPPPMDSVPWHCFCCKGMKGPKGDRGDAGLPGSPGSPGRRGLTGYKGQIGYTGRQGLKGQKGDDGSKGALGLMGFTGAKGGRGYKGEKGDMGMEGPAGDQGPKGELGECPMACFPTEGSVGDAGLPGITGGRGLPGISGPPGANGQKGDTGDIGPAGDPGSDGMKGEQGTEGDCDCQDGSKGADGSHGSMGPKGLKGDMGLKGITGTAGTQGAPGMDGGMGMPGPCMPAIQSAFSAALSAINPSANFPVVFDKVLYNMQGNYDPLTGIYMAPVNGTYVFSYHLATSHALKVGLFVNFHPIVKTTENSAMSTASQQVVLHLFALDQVWLLVREGYNGMYTDKESSSTFSGFMLHPDSCNQVMRRDFFPGPVTRAQYYPWGDMPGTDQPTNHP
ncbi:hypothetical protein SKAU_G00206460 [Synaphobranchus kaupii]|uniref:C1q domain-containing protein n=1 Tax=Synaphobranchus kaupii TaxID=118154 RepID=A0A9Q1FGH4_SYNKA|nr:hypothetical protein SKAU_G00206460 [Synaphobranchus kaupii]